MKVKTVTIQYSDTDISSLTLGDTVKVGAVDGGTIVMIADIIEPDATAPILVPHTHSLDAAGANTGPAIP